MVYPRFQQSRSFKFAVRTAGDVTVSATSFAVVDSNLDLTIDAEEGDVIEVGLSSAWLVAGSNTSAAADAVTRVGGADVNFVSGGTGGVAAWVVFNNGRGPIGGPCFYTIQSGDLESDGTVTVRLVAQRSGADNSLRASTLNPLQFSVRNLGPADPN